MPYRKGTQCVCSLRTFKKKKSFFSQKAPDFCRKETLGRKRGFIFTEQLCGQSERWEPAAELGGAGHGVSGVCPRTRGTWGHWDLGAVGSGGSLTPLLCSRAGPGYVLPEAILEGVQVRPDAGAHGRVGDGR